MGQDRDLVPTLPFWLVSEFMVQGMSEFLMIIQYKKRQTYHLTLFTYSRLFLLYMVQKHMEGKVAF